MEWEPDWHGDAVTYYLPVAEGGIPLSVWYDRAAAEKDRDAKQKLAADEVAAAMFSIDHSGCLFNSNRKLEAAEPFADRPLDDPVPVGEALHCELTEVERGNFFQRNIAKTAWDTAFVVMRLSWDREIENPELAVGLFNRGGQENHGVPMRIFALRSEAQLFCEQAEAEYRSYANPFRFRPAGLPHIGWDSAEIMNAVQNLGFAAPFPNPHVKNYDSYRHACFEWWKHVADGLTEQQRTALWAMTWDCVESGPLVFHTIVELRIADHMASSTRLVRTLYFVRATKSIPGGGPRDNPLRFLGAFSDPMRAEQVRADVEETFRQSPPSDSPPPVPYQPNHAWSWYSSMPISQVRQHLLEHGLIDESADKRFFPDRDWWYSSARRPFKPNQMRALWQVFDRVRLYEVLKLETELPE